VSEAERRRQEQAREAEIVRENARARRYAADPGRRDQIDPSTGRTWRDAVGRGLYGDGRLRHFRDMNQRFRVMRQQYARDRARVQGGRGWN
jgi:hypothetical protein